MPTHEKIKRVCKQTHQDPADKGVDDIAPKRRTTDNRKINANFKKGGFVGYQNVVLLIKIMQAKEMQQRKAGKNFI